MAKNKKQAGRTKSYNIVVPRTTLIRAKRTRVQVPRTVYQPVQYKGFVEAPFPLRTPHAKQAVRGRPTRPIPRSPIARSPSSYRTELSLCEKRSVRTEVLHALKKTGKGAPKHKNHYRRDENSKVKC